MSVCALKNATSSIVGAYRLGSSTTLLGSNDMVAAGYRSCHGYDALLRSCCASERKERVPQGGYLYILDHLFVYSKSRIKLAEKPRLNIILNIQLFLVPGFPETRSWPKTLSILLDYMYMYG